METVAYEAATYLADIFRSVGHPARIQILKLIVAERRCVYELCATLGIEQSNMSQHLRAMKNSGVITAKREGNRVYYSACCQDVRAMLAAVEAIASHCTIEQAQAVAQRNM